MKKALEAVRAYMKKKRLDAVLFHSLEYLSSQNLVYITGFTGSDAAVLITGREQHLFTDGRYAIQARQEAPGFTIHITRDTLGSIANLVSKHGLFRIGLETARVTHKLVNRLMVRKKELVLVEIDNRFIETFRIRKFPEEVEKIRHAAAIASGACEMVLRDGLLGKTELQVAWELESAFRRLGAEEPSFNTIVASGERSALPHARPTAKIIDRGDLVVIDYGAQSSGYCSDETVTCIVSGTPSTLQKRIHAVVYEAHNRAIGILKPGISIREVDRVARQCIDDAGFGRNFTHGLGHGVGLEVHEPPKISQLGTGIIEEGMVFTIEPGIYVEGMGGVRLESLIHMTGSGPEFLSLRSKDLISVD